MVNLIMGQIKMVNLTKPYSFNSDALPSHGVKHTWGFHKVKLRKVELGSTLPASNSRKG